mgnify:CR=1 FL=1
MENHASYANTIERYTSAELDEILHNVDRARFPERYEMVVDLLARRAQASPAGLQKPQREAVSQKPQSIRELIDDLVQPIEGRKARSVTFASDLAFWGILGLLLACAVPETYILWDTSGTALRLATGLLMAVQLHAIVSAGLKRPCTSFCLKSWAVLLVAYAAMFGNNLAGMLGEVPFENVPVALVFAIPALFAAGAVFVIAERYVTPVLAD